MDVQYKYHTNMQCLKGPQTFSDIRLNIFVRQKVQVENVLELCSLKSLILKLTVQN